MQTPYLAFHNRIFGVVWIKGTTIPKASFVTMPQVHHLSF